MTTGTALANIDLNWRHSCADGDDASPANEHGRVVVPHDGADGCVVRLADRSLDVRADGVRRGREGVRVPSARGRAHVHVARSDGARRPRP